MAPWSLRAVDHGQWQQHWQAAHSCTLTQSWEYGSAMAQRRLCRCDRLAILDQEGVVRGLMQCLRWSLPWLGGVVRINRGPVCCGSEWTLTEQDSFLLALRQLARQRRYRALFISLPWPDEPKLPVLLQKHGFVLRQNKAAWASHRLDLHQDEDFLRAQLAGKWRNLLRKSERQAVHVHGQSAALCWARFAAFYSQFAQEKQFVAVDPRLLGCLVRQYSPSWQCHLWTASPADNPAEWLAVLLSIHHGDSATYLIAANREEGRRLLCNYRLLWQAICHARNQGVRWFDLGGVNADTPEGIRHFKNGLNGTPYQWIGSVEFGVFRSFR
ncbi:MAG: peptidoglycan bridge formation glycyltransferase FemA/FemB family protein [Magnetococcales bacterium]|nr:peptidoglycan bridge formation glycyltransferase FemA/FemB family protein [Magnetococcales bacterium]MBF0114282.1 peptidoglycan bridge formation glycyltransferase FemA/FemB family protein [Magnetococcales bacterium]